MKLPAFQQIWEENRRFLLIAGGGLVVFLTLYSIVVSGAKSVAEGTTRTIFQQLEPRARSLHKLLQKRYHEESKRLDAYLDFEKDLAGRYWATAAQADVKSIRDPQLHFNRRIDAIWEAIDRKRSDQSLDFKMPEKISTSDLDVTARDGEADFRRHNLFLDLVHRALDILVDSGMKEIAKPRIEKEEAFGIRDSAGHVIVFQRARFAVRGPYESFAAVFRTCQASGGSKSGGALQALLIDLGTKKKSDGSGLLNGTLDFCTFYVEELPQGEK